MDKLEKFLKKLNQNELKTVHVIIEQLLTGNISELDIQKLKGFSDYYRVGKGSVRIIYHYKNKVFKIIQISRRSDRTYKDF